MTESGLWISGAWLGRGNNEWIEIDAKNAAVPGRWTCELPSGADSVVTLVFTPASQLYATIFGRNPATLYRLDRSTSSWRVVPELAMPLNDSGLQRVLGTDGEEFVFRASTGNLVWLPAPASP